MPAAVCTNEGVELLQSKFVPQGAPLLSDFLLVYDGAINANATVDGSPGWTAYTT